MDSSMIPAKYGLLCQYTSPVKKAERPIVGREAEIRRIKAALMRPELCNVMLLAPPGSGKALANGTEIPVCDRRGYVPIEQLKIGDMVYDETGSPTKILGVYPQGKKRAYCVHFNDGSSIICCEEHLWTVQKGESYFPDRKCRTVTLREIMDAGILNSKGYGKWRIPVTQPVHRRAKEQFSQVSPYAIGVLLGCGDSNSRRLCIKTPRAELAESLRAELGAASVRHNYSDNKWYFYAVDEKKYLWSDVIVDRMVQAGFLEGDPKSHKGPTWYLSRSYLLGSVEQRMTLLQGLMDSAGHICKDKCGTCYFETTWAELANFVVELARSLGLVCRQNIRTSGVKQIVQHRVVFMLPLEQKVNLFRCEAQRCRVDLSDAESDSISVLSKYQSRTIVGIDDMQEELAMTCIYVNSPSHLFLAGRDYIVTHNTAVVQGTMLEDSKRRYLEVDLSKMIAKVPDPDKMAAELKMLFDEVGQYVKDENREIVLFIDEFHQIVQLSAAAVEALKPLLADSGTRGIRVIAATTYAEFREYISPNQPLVERLQRINLPEADKKMTIAILRGMAKRYGVDNQFADDSLFELIYEYTNRYMPSNAQPRKSLLVLDAMVGYYRAEGRKMDMSLLADVIYQSEGVNVTFRVDATNIKKQIDKVVLSQDFATRQIEHRLQICVADLNNKDRPMSSFLFTGSSGVGKTAVAKALCNILFENPHALIRFDMSEMANPDSLDRFRRELTSQVWARPYCVLLLDEIEKSCAEVTRLLLQVLDDGRLTDANNRIVSFTNCYIILTTNAGSEVYKTIAQYNQDDTGSGKQMADYDKLIRESIIKTSGTNKFPPELLGRIDCLVPFQPLSENTMKQIATMNLMKLKEKVKTIHGTEVDFDKKVVRYLVEDNLDTDADSGGARAVMSKLESEVVVPVATYINAHPGVKHLYVYVDGVMRNDDATKRVSTAYITVTETPRRNYLKKEDE